MGHADHFLSRLDRLASAEVELALQLYRDPELLRAVLNAVQLPDGAERVAIALGEVDASPHIVVTRDGHFVTCLAVGMGTGPLPIVTRAQLDGLSNKFGTLRERLALATRLTGTESRERACSLLLRRVLTAADTVSREDFLAVSAWEPLLSAAFLDTYLAMSAELLQLGHALRNVRLPKSKREVALHDYWNLLHAAGHLALLGTMGGDSEHFQELTGRELSLRSAFSFALTSSSATKFIVQGAWAAGRLGKRVLPAYKRALAEDVAFFDWLDTVFALVAIGRRSSGLRAEVAKALRAAPTMAPQSAAAARLRQAMHSTFETASTVAADCMEVDDSKSEPLLLRVGGQLLRDVDLGSPADLPPDVVRAVPLISYSDGLTDGKKMLISLNLIVASARGAPEQFYLPAPYAKDWRIPWEPQLTEHLLEPIRAIERTQRTPAVRVAKPGPNEPCTCGSGRKYKKCCGSPDGTQ